MMGRRRVPDGMTDAIGVLIAMAILTIAFFALMGVFR